MEFTHLISISLKKNDQIKNVIFTTFKTEVDSNGNAVEAYVFFNDLDGTFLDAYKIENGVFRKKLVPKQGVNTQKASFFLLFQTEPSDDFWCDEGLGGDLEEVVVTAHVNTGGGSTSSYAPRYGNFFGQTSSGVGNDPIGNGGSGMSEDDIASGGGALLLNPITIGDGEECPDGLFKINNTCLNEEELLRANIVVIDPGQPKVDPVKELECFDLNQGARLIVYVQQPWEDSDAVVGANQVGHAFIGIEQGGIIRQVGYYPDKEVSITGVGDDYKAAIKTNYDYLYHVSISQNISKDQLTNIINYIINFPSTYNTNDYACTDFAIAIGNLGGMRLPSTTKKSLNFEGRSPGQLGQEIRALDSNATRTVTTKKSKSPSRKGNCKN